MEPHARQWPRLGQLALGLLVAASFYGSGATAASRLAVFQPTISSLKPQSALTGGAGFQLVVTGSHFGLGGKVLWNGTALATTGVPAGTSLTATVPASDLASAGSVSITVITGSGQVSAAAQFMVSNPAPVIANVGPVPVAAGVLNVYGSGFTATSVVQWNGQALQTSYISPAQLHATVPGGYLQLGQQASIKVVTPAPGGGTSKTLSVAEANPPAVLTGVSPGSFQVYQSGDSTLTLTGQYFVSGATVYWNGNALSTTYVSDTVLTAVAPAALFASPTPITAQVTVANPAPGGGGSGAVQVSDAYAVPQVHQVFPSFAAGASSGYIAVLVSGVGPTPSAPGAFTIDWNGHSLPAQFVGSVNGMPELTATVPGAYLQAEGTAQVTVTDSSGTSNALPAYVIGSSLTLTSAGPEVDAGSPAYTLTLTGTGFTSNMTLLWNGVSRAFTYGGPNQVQVQVQATDVAASGTVTLQAEITTPAIHVTHGIPAPSHKFSNILTYRIGTTITTLNQYSGQLISDETHGVLYATSDVPYQGAILTIDPAAGTVTGTLTTGDFPYTLAISDDDSYLYVGFPSSIQANKSAPSYIRRLSLPGLVSDINWQPASPAGATDNPILMTVRPGAPGTLAVLWAPFPDPDHHATVQVVDDGVARAGSASPVTVDDAYGSGYLAWGQADTFFMGDTNVGSSTLKVMAVGASGLSAQQTYTGILPPFYVESGLHYDAGSGYLFTDSGKVIDPATGASVTQLTMPGSTGTEKPLQLILDADAGRAYMVYLVPDAANQKWVAYEIVSYDLTTLSPLGTFLVPTTSPSLRPTLVRWGSEGLALRDDGMHIFIIQGAFLR